MIFFMRLLKVKLLLLTMPWLRIGISNRFSFSGLINGDFE